MVSTKTNESTSRLAVEIADDRMQAWIRLVDPSDFNVLTFEEVVPALEAAEVTVDDGVRGRAEEFVNLVGGGGSRPERFLVAQGRPAMEGKDGEFLWHESLEKLERDWRGDARVNYYTPNAINTVEKDQPIGTLSSSGPGTNGVDVLGNPLAPTRHPKDIELDPSVRHSDDDSTTVLANRAGRVVFEQVKLSISEVLNVKNDVDAESGSINSPIDIHIGGTILDGLAVKSGKAISVGGAIEAAVVHAQRDVIVRGGIIQRDKGSVSSGGDIIAKFCDAARLRATGNVKIAKELVNSQIHCMEKLLVEQGAVVGGQIYARQGVEVATLGSDASVPTEVTVGMDPNVVLQVEQLRESLKPKRQTIERIRQSVQPLLADVKRLTPAQKEQATELLFQADEADEEITEAEIEHEKKLEQARPTDVPYALVSTVVHRGVSIQIGSRKTTFAKDVKGPIRIEKRKVTNRTELVAVDQLSGSVTVLKSTQTVE